MSSNQFKFLAQGTLYPDVVESSNSKDAKSQVIKSHHNVGGLPEDMDFKLIEPLRDLFKDEVREVGRRLGVPSNIIDRHPFPGPGLAIRIIGEVTKEKCDVLRQADNIFIEELKNTPSEAKVARNIKFADDSDFWKVLENQKTNDGVNTVLAIIVNPKGQIFVQKRSSDRKYYSDMWDISSGGVVEHGESIKEALAREIREETSWELEEIYDYCGMKSRAEGDHPMVCFCFVVKVTGDLENPILEQNKVTQCKWIDETSMNLIESNIEGGYESAHFAKEFFEQKKFKEFVKDSLYHEVWQAFCVLTEVKSVGVMGDSRTYENLLGIRAVTAVDGMTADWARLPYEFLAKVSNRIINEVRGVNRVAYDISSKPPATIEWE
jgi:GMP synthase PP-ATPase subunit/8-oxo-dGTP pyrophosphatase MutT (NUDIX family)